MPTTTTVTRTIRAPAELVFDAVSSIDTFSTIVPEIVRVEHLSETHVGVGARFRETRDMNGRRATSELEVTEYERPNRVRLISDQNGAIWDSLFTVEDRGGHSVLTFVMEARAYNLLAKLVTPFIKGMVQKAIESDMDAVKAWCEEQATAAAE